MNSPKAPRRRFYVEPNLRTVNALALNPAQLLAPADYQDFHQSLESGEQAKTWLRLQAMQIIETHDKGIWAGCVQAAFRFKGAAHGGMSAKRLFSLHKEWRASDRDWRVLAPKRSKKEKTRGRHPEFVKLVNTLVGESVRGRDCKRAAWERLMREWWLTDRAIPGFPRRSDWWTGTHPRRLMPSALLLPDVDKGEMPEGLGYSTFCRAVTKDKAVTKAQHTGYHDAHDHLPQLLRDRSALRPLELVVADDWRSDLQVLAWVEGEYQVCYLNTLFFRCVGTGRIVAWAVKPMVARLDDKTKTQLCRADMAMLLAMMIREHGLPRDYALNLLLENATATLSELDEMLFQSAFSGRLLVDHTGMARKQLLASGFRESGGQPWQKGWIEVYFRSLATRLSHLLGSTGRRYDDDPATLKDMAKYALTVAKAGQSAGVPLAELEVPLLTVEQAQDMISLVVKQLDLNRDHAMQGFREVLEFLGDDGEWHPVAKLKLLPAPARIGRKIVTHRESAQERWLDLSARWPRDPIPEVALWHLAAAKQEKPIRNGAFRWKDARADDKVFWLPTDLRAEWEGKDVVGILSDDGQVLHLRRPAPDLRPIASLSLDERPNPLDKSAMGRAMNRVGSQRKEIMDIARDIQAPKNARFEAMRAVNDARLGTEAAGAAMLATEAEAKAKKAKRLSPDEVQKRRSGALAAL